MLDITLVVHKIVVYYYQHYRQSDTETIGKVAVRQDVSNCCFTPAQGAASSLCNCSTCLHKVRTHTHTHTHTHMYIYIYHHHTMQVA